MVGDDQGNLHLIKLTRKEEQITDFTVQTQYDGLKGAITTFSITYDHDLVAASSADEQRCQSFDFKTGSHIRNLTFSESNSGPNVDFVSVIFSHN